MNFQFRKLQLPQPPQSQDSMLRELANQSANAEDITDLWNLPPEILRNQNLSPRDIDTLIAELESGNSDGIRPLEWIFCLYAKCRWDDQHLDRRIRTAQLIWETAQHNPWLKRRLFWLLILHYSGRSQALLPASIAETFLSFAPRTEPDHRICTIIQYLENQNWQGLAQFSFDQQLTPQELFEKLGFPFDLVSVRETFAQSAQVFANSNIQEESQLDWLLQCFEQMAAELQVQQVEALLAQLSVEAGGRLPRLVDWLDRNYGPRTSSSRWAELSDAAKKNLRKWIGAVNYIDFQQIVDCLLNRLSLPQWQHTQLESRREFWANYSDRFQRLRILLPNISVKTLGNYLEGKDISLLKPDGSEPTEIGVFDLGEWIVVEFFRGSGSETRLFDCKKYPEIEQKLFNASDLSVKQIRCWGGQTHDHVYCWQHSCEKLIRQKGIYPNEGTTHFKGLSSKHNRYDPQTGLPTPSPEKLSKRQFKLKRWQQTIAELEQESRGYC